MKRKEEERTWGEEMERGETVAGTTHERRYKEGKFQADLKESALD